MTWLGFGLFWFSYSVLTYGWSQLQHSNVSLFDLMWPGRYDGNTHPDSGNPGAGSGSGGTSATGKTMTQAVHNQEAKTGTTPSAVTRNPGGGYTSTGSGVSP